MNHSDVQAWLDRYVEAWRTYDRALIGDLFSEDAEYLFHPWDEPVLGRQAIVDAWFEDQDAPGTWQAAYEPVAVEGDVAVARGLSRYFHADGSLARVYQNLWILRFDEDGRCRSFTEWYMKEPDTEVAA